MQKSFCFFISLLFVLSCAGHQQKFSLSGEERIIAVQYDYLFAATKEYVLERGYEIVRADKKSGEIETDYKPGAGWSYKTFKNAEKRARIRAKVTKVDSNHTKLALEIISQVRELAGERVNYIIEKYMNPSYEIPNSDWQPITGDNRGARLMYNGFFKGIIAKAKKLKM